jgi:hypothetical protein
MTYSRRQTIEEKNNKRKALGFSLLSIGFVLFMFFYGLPLLVKVANVAYDFKKSAQPIEINDTTPPPTPRIDSLPKATNKDNILVEGSSESGSTVVIDLNGNLEEIVTDSDGRFSTNLNLKKGDNFIKAYAKDTSNNKSGETDTSIITFDTEPPELSITSPTDNTDFYGSGQKMLTIKGTTEADAKLQINDRLAIVDSNGNFSFTTALNDGTNNFNVKSTDTADNTKEISFKVNFTP